MQDVGKFTEDCVLGGGGGGGGGLGDKRYYLRSQMYRRHCMVGKCIYIQRVSGDGIYVLIVSRKPHVAGGGK